MQLPLPPQLYIIELFQSLLKMASLLQINVKPISTPRPDGAKGRSVVHGAQLRAGCEAGATSIAAILV